MEKDRGTNVPNPAQVLRELGRSIATASDTHVARVVAVVDTLSQRGAIDDVIKPVRHRLATLRLSRPLSFGRLLFLPLDPLIVPAPRWRPGKPTIPRSTLPAFAATIRHVLGPESLEIDEAIAHRRMQDTDAVTQAGGMLWPKAAHILSEAVAPVDWPQTGLDIAMYSPLARMIGAVMAQSLTLQSLMADAVHGVVPPDKPAIEAMLRDVMQRNPDSLTMIVTLLIARVPGCATLLPDIAPVLGEHGAATMRLANDKATEALLIQLETGYGTESDFGRASLSDAGMAARRLTSLLKGIKDSPSPPRQDRMDAVTRRLDASCRARFANGMASEFLAPLREIARAGGQGDIAGVEAAARGLRQLEMEARFLGSGTTYDALLRQAAEAVTGLAVKGSLPRAGTLRLVEILLGADAALAMTKA